MRIFRAAHLLATSLFVMAASLPASAAGDPEPPGVRRLAFILSEQTALTDAFPDACVAQVKDIADVLLIYSTLSGNAHDLQVNFGIYNRALIAPGVGGTDFPWYVCEARLRSNTPKFKFAEARSDA